MKLKIKKDIRDVDTALLVDVILLIIFGLFSVASASFPATIKYNVNRFYYLIRQMIWMILGIFSIFFILKINKNFIKNHIDIVFGLSLLLIFLLWTPMGKLVNGQVRWLKIVIGSREIFSFQPSDLLKVASIVYMAKFLSNNIKRISEGSIFLTVLLIMGLSVIPIMVKDFSTAVVIGLALFAMFTSAGMTKKEFFIILVIGLGVIAIILMGPGSKFRRERIASMFADSDDKMSNSLYQITQSLYAIALGGYTGSGFFQSKQKYANLPEAHTDFIFSVICEEFGFVGALFLIILYLIFIYRGFVIASRAKDNFYKFTAIGLTTYIGIQAFFNLGVAVKILPVTGITLPFISYGGTALVMSMVAVGLLLKISKEGNQ
ncbi:FtsW/RodA/SpoVE family cell cycle protein [Peptoniphilus raoultii]|uniref:FtsW/RodA/SpoVE family cell cycle protein n=1 Tax=Peptoniphilus raoultii TaxID=1776387 RepID=UPI0008D937A7|nr:putative peptidoglycan glycosyltransferase FtsW [Peptoniphilus raoultii]